MGQRTEERREERVERREERGERRGGEEKKENVSTKNKNPTLRMWGNIQNNSGTCRDPEAGMFK